MSWKYSIAILIGLFLLHGVPTSEAVSLKYKKYVDSDDADLLLLCVEGDDQGCYFYGGRQAKAGNLKAAHDAYLIGAQNAKTRSGYVCIFQLARLYEAGQGVKPDLVQAYRWLSVILRLNGQADLKTAATTLRARVTIKLSAEQIAFGEALSKRVNVK
jgi:TPR repeat protein